jgi:hypothetical protein
MLFVLTWGGRVANAARAALTFVPSSDSYSLFDKHPLSPFLSSQRSEYQHLNEMHFYNLSGLELLLELKGLST